MGQYFVPILSTGDLNFGQHIDGYAYSHDFDEGLKLMEHSWLDRPFMQAITHELAERPRRLVWAGDYADPEPPGSGILYNAEEPCTLYSWVFEAVHMAPFQIKPKPDGHYTRVSWIVNRTRKEMVHLDSCPKGAWGIVHPLPLLTAEGNGRGGGDFRGVNEYVGAWARDLIQAVPDTPAGDKSVMALARMGFAEIHPNFLEE